jgi:hypothetical protein
LLDPELSEDQFISIPFIDPTIKIIRTIEEKGFIPVIKILTRDKDLTINITKGFFRIAFFFFC